MSEHPSIEEIEITAKTIEFFIKLKTGISAEMISSLPSWLRKEIKKIEEKKAKEAKEEKERLELERKVQEEKDKKLAFVNSLECLNEDQKTFLKGLLGL